MSTVTLLYKHAFVDSRPPVVVPARPTEDQLRLWLVDYLARLANVHPADIEMHELFASYGLDSISAARLVGELESWLKVEIPATLAWDYPTVDEAARFLAPRTKPR
ncbi:MAG TPA: acyl carrier protein [Pirellulales bacterium]